MTGLRERVLAAVRDRDVDELERVIAGDRRAVRHLVGVTFRSDPESREIAARGLAIAARCHPTAIRETVRRLIWAMNEESGTNAIWAPDALRAIAAEAPELVLPVVPDLMRLAADPSLRDRVTEIARIVAARYPSDAAERVERTLTDCMRGKQDGTRRDRRA